MATDPCVYFDVRGCDFKMMICDIMRLPEASPFMTLLEKELELSIGELQVQTSSPSTVIQLKRDTTLFESVLNYLDYGELHFPHYICSSIVEKGVVVLGFSSERTLPMLFRYVYAIYSKYTNK